MIRAPSGCSPTLDLVSRATFTHTVPSAAPVSYLWRALQHPQAWSAISGIDQVYQPKFDEAGLLDGFQFSATVGGRSYGGTARVTDRRSQEQVVLHIETTELEGMIVIGLRVGSSTEVTVTMEVGPRSFAARLAFGLVRAAIDSGFSTSAEQFVAQLEA